MKCYDAKTIIHNHQYAENFKLEIGIIEMKIAIFL